MGTDAIWQKWGRTEPYFSVVSDEIFRGPNLLSNLDLFFTSGEDLVETLMKRSNEFVGQIGNERAMDFGCGVGRLTMPLASRFKNVVGVDISDDMLNEAQRNCTQRGIVNAQFVRSDDHLDSLQQFDFIMTVMVLQHIASSRGMHLLDRLLELVKPGGCAVIHLSLLRPGGAWARIKYFLKNNFSIIGAIRNGLMGMGFWSRTMRMTEYNLTKVVALFQAHHMSRLMLMPSYHGDILTCFLIAKKSA